MLTIYVQRVHRRRIGNMSYGWTVFGPNLPFWRRHTWYLWPPGYVPHAPTAAQSRITCIPLAPGFELHFERERPQDAT